jgi:UDP-2-acetamido-3-amino-2,3-dideoxy-glucuronate N-acetyltransferase
VNEQPARIHPTADVAASAIIGPGTSVWNQAQVRDGARIGSNCVLGKNAYVDAGVQIGDRVKIQNNVSVYHGVTIEDGVFVGPHVCFTNDKVPRAINRDGSAKTDAMVGSGSVVTHDVADYELVAGNPARRIGSACPCGEPLRDADDGSPFEGNCPRCGDHMPPTGEVGL